MSESQTPVFPLAPHGRRLVVEPDRDPGYAELQGSGLVVVGGMKERFRRGTVVAVSPGWWHFEGGGASWATHQVAPGDRVLYHPLAGDEFTVDGRKILIMTEDNVAARFTEES